MAAGRRIGFAILGMFIGLVAGGFLGLIGGLGYTQLAGTSSFEGYSGYVVGFWIFGGMLAGLTAGLLFGIRLGRS
jgi:hypothetical protein